MSHALEVPTEKDFLETSFLENFVDLINSQRQNYAPFEKDIKYRKGVINFRSIVDFIETDIVINVIEDDKYAEFEKKSKEWEEKAMALHPPHQRGFGHPVMVTSPGEQEAYEELHKTRPEVPTREMKIKGVYILYFNSAVRMSMEDYDEFKEKYFEWLAKERVGAN